jgi:sugar phosphate isomerase/epimerase
VHFGISTHLYHDRRLGLAHLREIAAHGFTTIELFATRSHFDYHDPAAIAQLAAWLQDTGLTLNSVHAPITESLRDGKWGRTFSNATADEAARQVAIEETGAALAIAKQIPYRYLIVHLGGPKALAAPGDNQPEAARRSLEAIDAAAAPLGVRVAVEVIPNDLSTPAALVRLLEEEMELPRVGVCLDIGHAFLLGDAVDAVETLSGHIATTHLHDNYGTSDDHLTPFAGGIDWPGVVTAFQKVGYEDTWLLEVANTIGSIDVLQQSGRARKRMEGLTIDEAGAI